MYEQTIRPNIQISSWVKNYFIIEYNELFEKYNKEFTLSSLKGNCWIFIISDSEIKDKYKPVCHFFEIDNFSKIIQKYSFKYMTKFRILCIEFELGVSLKKVFGPNLYFIIENLRLSLNFDLTVKEIANLFDSIFDKVNIEMSKSQELTIQIITHLKENPFFKINELCDKFYLCNRQLQRIFQQQTGYSLKTCQKYIRINTCLQMILLSKGKNYSEVIYSMGYFDHNHFLKEFKMYYGDTPRHLLRNNAFFNDLIFYNEKTGKENYPN
ncbi:MAG: helix-turn-helix transcriptional regulator [Saprospiraceae bacterium]|nr:helix-turn-helix transcriptional regulator [Saprospiraceae bacterium]